MDCTLIFGKKTIKKVTNNVIIANEHFIIIRCSIESNKILFI